MKYIHIIISMFLLSSSSMGQHGKTFFTPEVQKVKLGEKFKTQIVFYTGNEPLSAFDIHLKFDPTILKVLSVKNLQPDLFTYHRPFKFDNRNGKIDASAYQYNREVPSDNFAIAEITFIGISPEKTLVKHVLDDFPKTIMAYGGVNMLQRAKNLKIEIVGETLRKDLNSDETDLGLEVWPNPSRVSSQIQFETPYSGRARLGLYDLKGNLISDIYQGNVLKDTPYQFEIDVQNLSNGIYYCRILTGDYHQTAILVVSK